MSTQIPELSTAIEERTTVYLLTVDRSGHPHAAEVYTTGIEDTGPHPHLVFRGVGSSAGENIDAGSQVSLMWPPAAPGGYTLIVNGAPQLGLTPGSLEVEVTRAVLHRPGAGQESECGSDCIPIVG